MEIKIDEKINLIENKINSQDFLKNRGLANEVGYYIFDYPPKYELYIREQLKSIILRVNSTDRGYKIIEIDLFELLISILKNEGYLEDFFTLEQEEGFVTLAEAMVETLGLDETSDLNLMVTKIVETVRDNGKSVIFLTGIGKCYPIIRSHNILNNLHQVMDASPVVLFFPGQFSGQDLKLFNTLESHNYYRAFPLII